MGDGRRRKLQVDRLTFVDTNPIGYGIKDQQIVREIVAEIVRLTRSLPGAFFIASQRLGELPEGQIGRVGHELLKP